MPKIGQIVIPIVAGTGINTPYAIVAQGRPLILSCPDAITLWRGVSEDKLKIVGECTDEILNAVKGRLARE